MAGGPVEVPARLARSSCWEFGGRSPETPVTISRTGPIVYGDRMSKARAPTPPAMLRERRSWTPADLMRKHRTTAATPLLHGAPIRKSG